MFKNIFIEGLSGNDRISFSSLSYTVTAIREKDGKIDFDFSKSKISVFKAIALFLLLFYPLPLIVRFFFIPSILKGKTGALWYLLPAVSYLVIALFDIFGSKEENNNEFLKNHGAEHKVVNYYLRYNKIPCKDDLKSISHISRYCGISIYSSLITTQLIGFIVFVITNGFVIPEIVLIITASLLSNYYPFCLIGMLFQHFTTAEPSDSEIELALAAFNAFQAKSNYYKLVMEVANDVVDKYNKELTDKK